MYCMNCGTEIPDGAAFCPECGSKVIAPPVGQAWQTPVQAAPQAPQASYGPAAQPSSQQVPQAPYGASQAPYATQQPPYGSQPQSPYGAAPQQPRKSGAEFMRTVASKARKTVGSMAGRAVSTVNQMAGGSEAEVVELRFRDFVDAVPKRHGFENSEEVFICGTRTTTPTIDKVAAEWPHPWVYSRVLALFVLTFLGCVALYSFFGNDKAIPGIIFIGALMTPFSALVFFFEVNAPRTISIAETVVMFFMGGIGSILLLYPVSVIFPGGGVYDFIPAMVTGLTEELAKILIIVIFMRRAKERNYVLSGLLFGAAVGAGFAVFESAGYAYEAGIAYGYEEMIGTIVARGVLSIGGHVAWAAVEGAALALGEGDNGFSFAQLRSRQFLMLALIPVVLHGLWDTYVPVLDDVGLFGIPVKCYLLTIAIWIVLAVMLHRGLAQVNTLSERAALAAREAAQREAEMAAGTSQPASEVPLRAVSIPAEIPMPIDSQNITN